MKCLTILQPFASLILCGIKTTETRRWPTSHRGPLLIHASSRLPDPATLAIVGITEDDIARLLGYGLRALPRGAIIGAVNVDACWTYQQATASDDPRDAQLGYGPGHYYWKLSHPRSLLRPIRCKGQPGLWDTSSQPALEESLKVARRVA